MAVSPSTSLVARVMLQLCTIQFHTCSPNSSRWTNNPMTLAGSWVDRANLALPRATVAHLTRRRQSRRKNRLYRTYGHCGAGAEGGSHDASLARAPGPLRQDGATGARLPEGASTRGRRSLRPAVWCRATAPLCPPGGATGRPPPGCHLALIPQPLVRSGNMDARLSSAEKASAGIVTTPMVC